MLTDEIEVIFKAGNGGAGKVSFYKISLHSGPDGGNGGRGGDIYVKAVDDLTLLNQFSRNRSIEAERGQNGGRNRKSGKDGNSLIVNLPLGTEIIDKENGEIKTLDKKGEEILICSGGLGGKGNYELKSARHTTPTYAQPGLKGQRKELRLVLKIIADFGLIGLPNSGKSSLLNELTAANAKIGNYPFTTLEPNLGVLNGKIIADIPGLIEGASKGKGLGTKFLKHIEKVKLLLHCISTESEDPITDYQTVVHELLEFNPDLINKEQKIILTKTDLVDKKTFNKKVNVIKRIKKQIIPVSIYDWESIEKLKSALI